MIRSRLKCLLAFAVGVLALGEMGSAYGQYVTGTTDTAGGGQFVIGSGTSLGSLLSGANSNQYLTLNGFDNLTLNLGSQVTDTTQQGATILFTTNGNVVLNNGIIIGNSAGNSLTDFVDDGLVFFSEGSILNETVTNNGTIISTGDGGGDDFVVETGLAFAAQSGSISGITIVNTGTIAGGTDGGGADAAGSGIAISAGNGIYNVSITNSGQIIAGSFGGDADAIGTGISIIDYNEQERDINGITINNSGSILGGFGNEIVFVDENATVMSGAGIGIAGFGNVSNISITNTASGIILGGSFNSSEDEEEFFGAAFAGTGIGIASLGSFGPYGEETGPTALNGVSIFNAGGIIGSGDNNAALDGGSGIFLGASGTLSNVSIVNSGSIGGGDYNFDNLSMGNGISMASGFIFTEDLDEDLTINADIDTVGILNSGIIYGGFYNDESFVAGNGISLYSGPLVLSGSDTTLSAIINNVQIGNSGQIYGGDNNFEGVALGNGISLYAGLPPFGGAGDEFSSSTISNISIANTGIIAGGYGNGQGSGPDDEEVSFAGNGVSIASFAISSTIANVTIGNSGQIYGGDSNGGEFEDNANFSGNGISIVSIGLESTVSNITIANSGLIAGGYQNSGIVAGNAISLFGGVPFGPDEGTANITGVTINNSGSIIGGQGNFAFEDESFALGNGVVIASFAGSSTISNITINNTGLIAGGNGNSSEGILFGDGIVIANFFAENGLISNILINNAGTIAGGNSDTELGDGAGEGIAVFGESISGLTINNFGNITGGNTLTDEDENAGGNAIDIEATTLSNVTINNYRLIEGGDGASGGAGIRIDAGVDPDLAINNYGTILGGNGITTGWNGGDGIDLNIGDASNAAINNYGLIIGGNASAGGFAGYGINASTNGLTVNNWGVISAGAGLSQAANSNFPAVAVGVYGNNNVINLNGHSAVYGTLEGQGSNNRLNLNFTGLSPQAIASLNAQIAAGTQGDEGFTGTFTVRGVTYYVDPLILGMNVSSYQLQGLTPNQAAVGASLDSITTNPQLGSALGNLYNAIDNSGNVPRALEALSPQPYQIYSDIAEATANFMTLSIDARLNNLRDGSENIDTTGIGGGSDAQAAAGFDKDGGKTVVQQSAPERRWGFFAQGQGLTAQVDAHGPDLLGANFTTAGLLLGVDGRVNDNLVLGLLFNYDYTSASLDPAGSNANVQTLGGGIYAGYHNGNWFGNGLIAYGHNSYESNRNIVFPGFTGFTTGNTSGDQEIVNIDGGYDVHVNDKLTISPIAGLQYVHLGVDGFDESGLSAANLAVGSQDVDSLRSRIGFRADFHKQIGKEVAFAAEVRAAWQHEFLDHGRSIDGDFIGTGLAPFSVRTYNPGRDAALLGVGVNFTVRDRATLYFDYDVQAGQQSYLEQSVRGGIKLSF